jgi:hypothetical protein
MYLKLPSIKIILIILQTKGVVSVTNIELFPGFIIEIYN